MNEKIVLKTGKEYPLVTGGTSSTPSALRLVFQTADPVEDVITVFSDGTATAQIKALNEDGSTLAIYDGYTVLDNPKSVDDHYLITPAVHDDKVAETTPAAHDGAGDKTALTAQGDNEAEATPAVYGRVVILTLSQPGLRALREHDRADIDYLAVMTGTSL